MFVHKFVKTPFSIVVVSLIVAGFGNIATIESATPKSPTLQHEEIPVCSNLENRETNHSPNVRSRDSPRPHHHVSSSHTHQHDTTNRHLIHSNRTKSNSNGLGPLASAGNNNLVKMWMRETNENRKLIKARRKSIVPLIIDTDLGMFADDPLAFAIAHRMADQDQIHILATVGSTRYEGIAMAINTLNTFLGRPNIPVGVTRSRNAYTDQQGSQNWTEYIRTNFPHKISKNSEAEDAILVYRRALENAADRSVTILQIGHFTNLASLLESHPDKISKLDGNQLVRRKVREVVTMAGNFRQPKNWNIEKDITRAQFFTKHWPTRVTFVGSEISDFAQCGGERFVQPSINNPISASLYFTHKQFGVCTGYHDAVATLMVLDRETSQLFCAMPGTIEILSDGSNKWLVRNTHSHSSHNNSINNRNKLHRYLRFRNSTTEQSRSLITERINHFLPANRF